MDKSTVWTEAFYGGSIPESQRGVASHDIVQLVMTIKGDLRRRFPDITDAESDEGTEAVLRQMRYLGASHPNVYKEQEALAIKAYQHGVARVRDMRFGAGVQSDREEGVDLARRMSVREAVMGKFEKWRTQIVDGGDTEDISLNAWKSLVEHDLDALLDLGGYAFFLINWQIPQKEGIYDHPELMRVCNEHPRLLDREPTRLKINGMAWRGKY